VREKERRRGWRGWLAPAVAAVLVVAVVVGSEALSRALYGRSVPARAQQAPMAVQDEAAAWVATQVSRSAVVSCDLVMCQALEKHGIPGRDLHELKPGSPAPLHSDVIVVTAAIRAEFGASLNFVYAPGVIASFGSAITRIDIRVIAPKGATAYRSALRADLAARKKAGPALLLNPQISASATARRQLTAGQVDSRLMYTLAVVASMWPVSIVTFGNLAPGASPGIPLRYAYLAQASGEASAGPAAQARQISGFVHGLRGFYSSARIQTVRLAGQNVVRIEFAAPSPLGVLKPSTP
jgi:hypothetical protein